MCAPVLSSSYFSANQPPDYFLSQCRAHLSYAFTWSLRTLWRFHNLYRKCMTQFVSLYVSDWSAAYYIYPVNPVIYPAPIPCQTFLGSLPLLCRVHPCNITISSHKWSSTGCRALELKDDFRDLWSQHEIALYPKRYPPKTAYCICVLIAYLSRL